MAAPASVKIEKVVSAPADPSAPSILTMLAPEIRNSIYEHLFKRDEPVLLHDPDAYRRSLVIAHGANQRFRTALWNNSFSDLSASDLENIDSRTADVEHLAKENEFRQGFGDSIAILQTCKQIYHEAAGILYGSNTFLFTQAVDQPRSDLYNPQRSADKWLSELGSQYSLLSNVQIDAGGFDTGDRDGDREHDLLPLLKHIWANPTANCKISFVRSGRFPQQAQDVNWPPRVLPSDHQCPTDLLNNLLITLGENDALNIRRYARYPQLMSGVIVQEDEKQENEPTHGAVAWQHPSTPLVDIDVTGCFEVHDCGLRVIWMDSKNCYPLSLPLGVVFSIDEYMRKSSKRTIFDLDAKKVTGVKMGLLGVSSFFRTVIRNSPRRSPADITLKMSTKVAYTDFNNFQALREWASIDNFRDMMDSASEKRPCSMILNFDLNVPHEAKELEIGIGDLFKILYYDTDATITIQGFNKNVFSARQITWHDLQVKVFLFLSDLLLKAHSWCIQPTSQIWINGDFKILGAEFPATPSRGGRWFPCTSHEPDSVDIQIRGYERIRKVENFLVTQPISHFPQHFVHRDSLMCLWFTLRNEHWSDWPLW